MRRAAMIQRAVTSPCPFERELDRLLALLESGAITRREYEADVRAVERAMAEERAR